MPTYAKDTTVPVSASQAQIETMSSELLHAPQPRGLYSKYIIHKASTGEPLDGPAFVLRYDRDPAARAALACYADQVAASNPELAADLRAMLASVSAPVED